MFPYLMMLPAAYQMYQGIKQGIQASKYEKTPRPTYEIPEAATTGLNLIRSLSTQTEIPGASAIRGEMGATLSGALGQMGNIADSSSSLLGAATNLYGNKLSQDRQLGIKGAEMYLANQSKRAAAEGDYAKYQDKAFDINKMQPYLNAMAAASALRGSSEQNIFGSLTGIAGAAGSYQGTQSQLASNDRYLKIMENYYGGGGNSAPTNTGIGINQGSYTGTPSNIPLEMLPLISGIPL